MSLGGAPGAEAGRDGPRVLPRPQRRRQLRARHRQGRHPRPGRDADRDRLGLQRPVWNDALAGNPPLEVVVPQSGILAGVYLQAISAYAPQPNAAKLWMEYLYSDEGQLGWLAGYCHPIRFNDLVEKGVVPQELLDASCRRPRPTRRRCSRPSRSSSPPNRDRDRTGTASSAPTCSDGRCRTPRGPGSGTPVSGDDRRRCSQDATRPQLGRARRPAVHDLRAPVPDPADDADRDRGVPHARAAR
jgi:hypothetical protein